MNLFSKNLRFLRKKGNHNQDAVSILFNKRANTVGNWENQKSEPNLAELMKLGEFFNVSVQDLLHTDMENQTETRETENVLQASAKPLIKSHSLQDVVSSTTSKEGSPDAFWMILRELRAIDEKVDLLVSGMGAAGFKKNSDKSNH